MARSHRMTPARRAALKKAQAASARKRRGRGKGKLAAANRSNQRLRRGLKYAAVGAAVVGGAAAYGYAVHKQNKRIRSAEKNIRANTARHMSDFKTAANRVQHMNFGTTRKQRAKGKLAAAAKGTSGSRHRRFVSHPPHSQPGGAVGMSASQKKAHDAKRRHETRLRQHAKAGARGHYNAGLSNYGGKAFVATRSGVSHRRR